MHLFLLSLLLDSLRMHRLLVERTACNCGLSVDSSRTLSLLNHFLNLFHVLWNLLLHDSRMSSFLSTDRAFIPWEIPTIEVLFWLFVSVDKRRIKSTIMTHNLSLIWHRFILLRQLLNCLGNWTCHEGTFKGTQFSNATFRSAQHLFRRILALLVQRSVDQILLVARFIGTIFNDYWKSLRWNTALGSTMSCRRQLLL